jgi:hypothetical protein
MSKLAQLIGSDGTVHYSRPDNHPDVNDWKKQIVERKLGYEIRILEDETNWMDPLTCKTTRFKLYYTCKLSGLHKWIPFYWKNEGDINDVLRGVCVKCTKKCQFNREKDLDYLSLVNKSSPCLTCSNVADNCTPEDEGSPCGDKPEYNIDLSTIKPKSEK